MRGAGRACLNLGLSEPNCVRDVLHYDAAATLGVRGIGEWRRRVAVETVDPLSNGR